MNKITLTGICPRGPENIWYINGDDVALNNIGFARLLDPGLPYKIVSELVWATYHVRDGVVAREIEFNLKPLVSEWHSAILFREQTSHVERIRVGWADYDPMDTHYLVRIGWDENPELLKGILRYNLSQAYWEKFLKGQTIHSPFHSSPECWELCLYTPALFQKLNKIALDISLLQREMRGLFYGD